MSRVGGAYSVPAELVIGTRLNNRVREGDQKRQRTEVEAILDRLRRQPGVILADEVGMGKTFVALGVAYSVAVHSPLGPVIVMVPANLIDKWVQDLKTFCELYVPDRLPLSVDASGPKDLKKPGALRFGIARDSVALMKLLDDPPRVRPHFIFLAQSAMSRRQSDRWVRLALIAEALRVHGRGKAKRLIKVKGQIHRFLGELLWAIGEERRHDWGDVLWQRLLRSDSKRWKKLYNDGTQEDRRLNDDPVPKSVARALRLMNLKPLAEALEHMPVRARGGGSRVSERVTDARRALKEVERELWKTLLAQARWRSPLLVMDEAHHLKNPGTSLARQLQSSDSEESMRTGDGAMARSFDRMLFLTATPFQLGHHELVRVLERFGDVRWNETELGGRERFAQQLSELRSQLDDSQRGAIALQRAWSRLTPEDSQSEVESWWDDLLARPAESLTARQRAIAEGYRTAKRTRQGAEEALRPWIVRHNKGKYWEQTEVARRTRIEGGAIAGHPGMMGLAIQPSQLLPFFLAARSAISAGSDVLGEALSSSYEAFRYTREHRQLDRDQLDRDHEAGQPEALPDLAQARWYLTEFDRALEHARGDTHPKMAATVTRVVDLWASGEKVLVFAFYRRTCRALRVHISEEIKRRLEAGVQRRLQAGGGRDGRGSVDALLESVQKRFFDDTRTRGRRAIDEALIEIAREHTAALDSARLPGAEREELIDIMRRFLRAPTTLARCFPLDDVKSSDPADAVAKLLGHVDRSGTSWREKFHRFINFLANGCSTEERRLYLEAASRTQTGGIRVEDEDEGTGEAKEAKVAVANVQVATGITRRDTRARLMRAFNTPFFPDILVCSGVMGEGVDLQRFCRHVIHHDLAWNPSTIEQRTGRIDRLGCKAEGRQPIVVYLPYLAGTADERQYQVMSHREQWFRVVMGQDEVAKLITPDTDTAVPLPTSIADELSFKLGL